MKPIFEDIQPTFGNSFAVRRFTEENCSALPYWHFHPEHEIVFISNGRGKRHICDHVSHYEDGDLVFLGPNLPHLGFAQELYEQHVEIVVQMKEDFLGKDFMRLTEMAEVRQLFERSLTGLAFHGHTKWDVGQRLQNMVGMEPLDRLLELLKVLQILAKTSDVQMLNIQRFSLEVKPQEHLRMKKIYAFVEQNFKRAFLLEEVAAAVNLSVPAFCRFFRKLTHRTFIEFLNEFRIAYACRLLSEDHWGIAAVSYESGFNNLSHFNKQFKFITRTSPTEYRRNLRKVVLPKNTPGGE